VLRCAAPTLPTSVVHYRTVPSKFTCSEPWSSEVHYHTVPWKFTCGNRCNAMVISGALPYSPIKVCIWWLAQYHGYQWSVTILSHESLQVVTSAVPYSHQCPKTFFHFPQCTSLIDVCKNNVCSYCLCNTKSFLVWFCVGWAIIQLFRFVLQASMYETTITSV